VAEACYQEALRAADPEEAVFRHFRVKDDILRVGDVDYFLDKFQRVFVIGAGKASVRMAQAVERILGPRLHHGLVITSRGQAGRLKKVLVREGSHPLPDEDGVRATEELLELVESLTDQDLVVCVLSGGGSALLDAPLEGISVSDLQRLTRTMLGAGMSIAEINAVRKRLSRVKAGQLARNIYPATIINLILSDVISDRLDLVASGPTTPDLSAPDEAVNALKRHGCFERLPAAVKEALLNNDVLHSDSGLPPPSEVFQRVHSQIVGSNRLSLLAAEKSARKMGMNTLLLSSSVCGESREIAHFYAALAREVATHHSPVKPPACLIAGGETTVTVTGPGKGGRCQELALAMALDVEQLAGVVFLAAGTDGVDGPTNAAGAIADSRSMERARASGLDPIDFLTSNDSYSFFQSLGDLIITGPTGTNVMDIHLLLVG
jgi:glycerate-2-kinase